MFRQLTMTTLIVGALAGACLPASAQVWGGVTTGFRIGHTPVGITIGTGPVYPAPYPAYTDPYYYNDPYYYPAPVYTGGGYRGGGGRSYRGGPRGGNRAPARGGNRAGGARGGGRGGRR